MTTDDGIDVEKLTSDAFAAIDTLFSDDEEEEDSLFGGGDQDATDDEPLSDFDRIREFMLAMEWEYSEKEVNRFNDFLTSLMSKYPGQYDQNVLKMMSSIVRYISKAKSSTVPETFHVLDSVAETFRRINQAGLEEPAIREEVTAVYQKVVTLKNKIAGINAGAQPEAIGASMGHFAPNRLQAGDAGSSSDSLSLAQDAIAGSPIVMELVKRLDLFEKRVNALETEVATVQQTNFIDSDTDSLVRQLESRIGMLEKGLGDERQQKLEETTTALFDDELADPFVIDDDAPTKKSNGQAEVDSDEIGFDEVNPEELSFDDMASTEARFEGGSSDDWDDETTFVEVSPDEMLFADDELKDPEDPVDPSQIVFDDEDRDAHDFSLSGVTDFDDQGVISSSMASETPLSDDGDEIETLGIDDIEYDELTLDDIYYEAPEPTSADEQTESAVDDTEEISSEFAEVVDMNTPSLSDENQDNADGDSGFKTGTNDADLKVEALNEVDLNLNESIEDVKERDPSELGDTSASDSQFESDADSDWDLDFSDTEPGDEKKKSK